MTASVLNDRGHLSSLTLDEHQLDLLDPEARGEVEAHLGACPRCSAALRELAADCGVFEQVVLPRSLPRLQAPARRRPSWLRLWLAAPATAVLAVAVLVLTLGNGEPAGAVLARGDLGLTIYAERGGEVFRLEPRAALQPGDRLRFVVTSARPGELLLLGGDGTGALAVYHPAGAGRSGPITAGRTELPGSVQLDAAPGPERFVALLGRSALEADQMLQLLRQGGLERVREEVELEGAVEIRHPKEAGR